MRIERLVAYLLFGITMVLTIAAFVNPIGTIDFIETDQYFKKAHQEALLIYAAFISIPAFLMLLWNGANHSFTSSISWLILATSIIICVVILFLTYFVHPYEMGFELYTTYSWYVAYALIALILLTILYLVSKLFKVGK